MSEVLIAAGSVGASDANRPAIAVARGSRSHTRVSAMMAASSGKCGDRYAEEPVLGLSPADSRDQGAHALKPMYGVKVLIVESHVPSFVVLRLALQAHGYVCDAAVTAADAVVAVTALDPHIVIYEWKVLDGVGLPQRLRAASMRGRLPVIALSTQPEPDDFRSNERVDAYITKPFQADQLRRVLLEVANER